MEHLPMTLQAIVDRAEVTPITVGMSGDQVYRIETDETYFLKIGESLKDEYERLEWLAHHLPTPRVIHFEVNHGKHYLLTSAISGQMLFEVDVPIERGLELLAEAAHMWHAVPTEDCPFQWGVNAQIDSARHALNTDRVDHTRFDPAFYGKTEHELFTDLLNAMPDGDEDWVLTHGDLCLPNILIDPNTAQITGFVDVGDMGVSDRHLDLVLAAHSIRYNWGSKYIGRFYELYGTEFSAEKFHFYSILNEFC